MNTERTKKRLGRRHTLSNDPERARREIERRMAHAERVKKCVALRLAGCTYEMIGDALGIATVSAYNLFKGHLAKSGPSSADVDAARKLELMRIDRALQAIWQRVTSGDDAAVDRFDKLSRRRAALLGLDAPTRSELSGPDGGPITLSASKIAGMSDEELNAVARKRGLLTDSGSGGS